MKMKKQKYYAVKEGRDVKDSIFETWDECKEVVHGYNAVYKSFLTRAEAETYLGILTEEKVAEIKEITVKAIKAKRDKKSKETSVNIKLNNGLYKELVKKTKELDTDINSLTIDLYKELLDWI